MKKFELVCPNCDHHFSPDQVLKDQISKQLNIDLEIEKIKILKKAEDDAIARHEIKLLDLDIQLQEKSAKLKISNEEQLLLLKKVRETEEKVKDVELEIEKRVRKQKEIIEDDLRKITEEKYYFELLQKDKKINDMNQVIEELKRKGSQNSSQLIGEVVELDFESQLANKYPGDQVTPVAKGQNGADIIHDVYDRSKKMGTILWEFKYAKAFSKSWITKLKENQTKAGANIGILVTNSLPKDCSDIEIINGIYVVRLSLALAFSISLRSTIISLGQSEMRNTKKDEKMSLVYDYLTGPLFKQKFMNIVDSYKVQKSELDKERRLLTKTWAKREMLLESVIENASTMYGDLEAIAANDLILSPDFSLDYVDHDQHFIQKE